MGVIDVTESIGTQRKREWVTDCLRRIREDKVLETKKKLDRFGYTDEDDYHYLVPPEDYDWEPTPSDPGGDFYGYRAWAENYAAMVDTFPPVVVPYSSVCGNYFRMLQKFRKDMISPHYPIDRFLPVIEKYNLIHAIGQVHHFCGDVTIGLKLGWGGLLEKIRHYAALNVHDAESEEFYASEELFVRTVIGWIRRTSEEIERKIALEENESYRENLRGMLAANRAVETGVPGTLREACQFISWYNIAGRSYNREGCGGQLDQVLLPYYLRDREKGLIDDEDAVFYIAGVLMSDTKYYQLGGPDADGKDMTSPVSWLILEAADRLNVTSNLTIRVHDGMDPAFMRRGVELLFKHKNAWPRFSGDESLVNGFVRSGFSPELARRRIAVGCNWMAIPAVEYGLNDTIKINFAKLFEVAFCEMMEKHAPSTACLWELFRKHLDIVLQTVAETTDFHLRTARYNSPELFLNLFTEGPIEKGSDASDHTLRYYNIAVDGAGIAVAADSFAALEQRVEDEGKVTWLQIYNAVKTNYASPQARRVRAWMQTAEKYGQEESRGLRWAVRISRLFTEKVGGLTAEEGECFIPGLFSWSNTISFGQNVGATPDGRLAGTPINHGANPQAGSVKNGEMTTMSEAICAVQCGRGNTAPFQMELDPSITTQEGGVDKVMALLKTHLSRGGTLINVNIIDADRIREAHRDPSLYPDLVVRVTGFTAYFISLSPEFRQLVVDRIMEAQ